MPDPAPPASAATDDHSTGDRATADVPALPAPRSRSARRSLHRLRESIATGVPIAPAHAAFGLRYTRAEEGSIAVEMPTAVAVEDGAIAVSGLLVLADALLGSAAGSPLPAGRGLTTLTIDLHCLDLRPRPTPRLVGSSRSEHVDVDSARSAGEITTEAGDVIAQFSSRCVLRDLPPTPAEWPLPSEAPAAGATAAPTPTPTPNDSRFWLDTITPVRATATEAVCTGTAVPSWANMSGRVQGGALAIVAERTLHQLWSTIDGGRLAASPCYDLAFTYLRGVPSDGREIPCRAEVVHHGRSLTVARAEILDDGLPALQVTASRYGRPRPPS